MFSRQRVLVLNALLIVLAGQMLNLTACAGDVARRDALLPAMQIVVLGMGLQEDIKIGIDSLPNAEQTAAFAALEDFVMATNAESDFEAVGNAAWQALRLLAIAGIDKQLADETIGPGVAESKRERVRNMDQAVASMLRQLIFVEPEPVGE